MTHVQKTHSRKYMRKTKSQETTCSWDFENEHIYMSKVGKGLKVTFSEIIPRSPNMSTKIHQLYRIPASNTNLYLLKLDFLKFTSEINFHIQTISHLIFRWLYAK